MKPFGRTSNTAAACKTDWGSLHQMNGFTWFELLLLLLQYFRWWKEAGSKSTQLEKSEGHYWGACQTFPFFSRLVNSRLCTWPSFLCQDKSVWVVHFNQAESFRDTERAQTPKKSFAAAIRPEFIAAGNTNCQDGGKVWGKRERWWVWSTVISCAAVAWSVALKIAFDQLFFAFCFSSSVWWI